MAAHQETVDVPVGTPARAAFVPSWPVGVATAGLTFLLAYANGAYALPTRHALAVGVWWAVIVAVVAGMAASARAVVNAVPIAVALAAFAAWTLASTVWATNAENAYAEFDRVMLYLGVFVLCCLLLRRRDVAAWCDGIGFGIAAVAVLALVGRLFPGTIGRESGADLLPALASRLSYPVGYWNGLGILCALALPLLLATSTGVRPRALRAAAAGCVPVLAAAVYLTSSRGAVATAVVAAAAFLLFTSRRWLALGTLLATAPGAAVAIALIERHPAIANGAGGSSDARTTLALELLAVAVVTAAGFAALLSLPEPRERPSPAAGWILLAATALLVAFAVVSVHPVRRFDDFKEPPRALTVEHGDYVKAHLLSGSGSGRWQFWQAAVDEFRADRLRGGGAGSYAEWWAAHGALATSIQDAHSLYLETLGELGVVGLVLLVLPFALAALVASRLRRIEREQRVAVAGAAAVVCGFLLAAGIDWMWELTVVAVVAFAALAVLVVSPDGGALPPRLRERGRRTRRVGALAAAALVAAWLAVCAEALPLLTQLEIGASQRAAQRGRALDAVKSARSAIRLQPWAASPYLQLSLVTEQAGRLGVAETAIRRAIDRAPGDWHLWLVAARIETRRGEIGAARRSLRRARSLNPRSPLFAPG